MPGVPEATQAPKGITRGWVLVRDDGTGPWVRSSIYESESLAVADANKRNLPIVAAAKIEWL